MNNKIAIQMDDIKTIDYAFDSSFMIGLEGQKRDYEIFYYHPNDLYIDNGLVKARGFYIELYEQDKNYFKFLSEKIEINLEEFKFIFLRQDPPFNMEYISNTYLLSELQNPVLINDPSEVRNFPEKHIMMNFPELTPPTLISSHIPSILAFIRLHKEVILKPAYGNGGCLLYTSPSPRDAHEARMPSSA